MMAHAELEAQIDRWRSYVQRSQAISPADVEELEDHLRTEYSTYTWLLEPMLERSGFSIRDAHYSEAGTFADYLCERFAHPLGA